MGDLGIIDRFMDVFIRYIDSGFGLLAGDVAFLTSILVGIDITLAGLFWAFDADQEILGRLIRKVLYVGVFALILNNFRDLADIIYGSFSGLGLQAAPGSLSAEDLLKPGKIAATGFEAAYPLLEEINNLVGFPEIFGNALTVFVLLVAWLIVVLAFFVLAIQLFITIIEFKLVTLAGFVLVPFALWSRTAFLAERVLGNVISAGVKVMVLAVIVGIGSTLFSTFTSGQNQEPDLTDAMSRVLGALTLLGLGIFGPGIASGLVSGAPQLGAGAALATAGVGAGVTVLSGAAALKGARSAAGVSLSAVRAGTALGSTAQAAYRYGVASSIGRGTGFTPGVSAVTRAGRDAAASASRKAFDHAAQRVRQSVEAARDSGPDAAPAWAKRLRAEQIARANRHRVVQAIKEGDRSGSGANPSLQQKDD